MQKAGYNPTASLTFFERLEAADKTRSNILSHAFEDHPDTPARIAALDVELRQIGYDVPAPTTTTPYGQIVFDTPKTLPEPWNPVPCTP